MEGIGIYTLDKPITAFQAQELGLGSFLRFCLCVAFCVLYAGLAVIVFLDASPSITIWLAARAGRLAALLLAPYLPWLCYASALNLAIALMNP